ncbi:class I SAM-dependent methyltransferase [Haloferula chungangensis]|uniref:Class I SAM-dependent methyltransferase n=1 Tax=Haloferula chungangensis TaxID=1048331 RepID=A0ABW2LCB1_9BACT
MDNQQRAGLEGDATSQGKYREEASEAIAGLANRIVGKIREIGPIPFPTFMEMSLYDSEAGYYARRADQVGRAGDFFTSVSAGPLFGRLLAQYIAQWWAQAGHPEAWRIIELGGHDGSLAGDILAEIRDSHPAAFAGLKYVILEPLEGLAAAQNERLTEFAGHFLSTPDPASLAPQPGYLIANEVLDALPFHLVESFDDGWHEIGVKLSGDDRFEWHDLGPVPVMTAALPLRSPGYRSEIRPDFAGFLKPLVRAIQPGRMLWIDYGFERDDYYAESRTSGTLRTFRNHQAGEDPLEAPGSQDITAHVDFTAMMEAIESLGGETLRFENQARFLTDVSRPWLLSLEGKTDAATMKLLRNFQTLTHPGQMGSRFHLLEAKF